MKVFLDTSVLVPILLGFHPQHEAAFFWLKQAMERKCEIILSAHSLAETYATVSAFPVTPRISSGLAAEMIRNTIENHARIVTLNGDEYKKTIVRIAQMGFPSGAIYDLIVLATAEKAGADLFLTWNIKDFLRFTSDLKEKIRTPDGRDIFLS